MEKNYSPEADLALLYVAIGWKPTTGLGPSSDLDILAFMLNNDGRLPGSEYLISSLNALSPDGAIATINDDRTGSSSVGGDDEALILDLPKVDEQVRKITLVVTVQNSSSANTRFGDIRKVYARIVDSMTGDEIQKVDLSERYPDASACVIGVLNRVENGWRLDTSEVTGNEIEHFTTLYAKTR